MRPSGTNRKPAAGAQPEARMSTAGRRRPTRHHGARGRDGRGPCPAGPSRAIGGSGAYLCRSGEFVEHAARFALDWKHFASWCRRQGLSTIPPSPQTIDLYITACASGTVSGDKKSNSVSTIERRLSSLSWNCGSAVPEDLIAILETLDRPTLLLGFAGGLRRSEITGLDCGRDQTEDGRGWIKVLDKGAKSTSGTRKSSWAMPPQR